MCKTADTVMFLIVDFVEWLIINYKLYIVNRNILILCYNICFISFSREIFNNTSSYKWNFNNIIILCTHNHN